MHLLEDARREAFGVWLRSGRLPWQVTGDRIEYKFNPWHDRDGGRFTFVGAGQHFAQGSARVADAEGRSAPPDRQTGAPDRFVDDPAERLKR